MASSDINGTQLLVFSGVHPFATPDQNNFYYSAPTTEMQTEEHDANGNSDEAPNELNRQSSFLETDTEASKQKEKQRRLFEFAAEGKLKHLKRLLDEQVDVNVTDYDRRSALHLAAAEGHFDMVRYMVECKANIHCKDRWGGTPLSDAKRGGHKAIETLLQSLGANDANGSSEPTEHGPSTGELMCMAAAKGRLAEIQRLVAGGASVNAADYDRRSALHLAAAEGHDAVVAFLIASGAEVNAKDRWGTMPLSDAVRGGHAAAQETLRRAGAVTGHDDHSDHASKFGEKMCNAAARGNLAEIKALVARGGQVNAADYDGRSALHLASAEGHDAVVEFLVAERADVTVRDRWGADPLKDAVRSGHRTVQAILLEAGAGNSGREGCHGGSITTLQEQIEVEEYEAKTLNVRAKAEKWSVDRDELVLGERLGEGEQGYVLKADWRGMSVVCKFLKVRPAAPPRRASVEAGDGRASPSRTTGTGDLDFENEIMVLSTLRHPNLVLFLGACVDREPKILISEFLAGGSLEDVYDRKQKERRGRPWRPPFALVHRWALQLAQALCFLHKCNPPIIHRDLKPGNLMLTAEMNLKLSDFGLSKMLRKEQIMRGAYQMTGVTGTVRYMAPEVIRSESYDEKVDIYSFSMVLWYTCTGERPLAHCQPGDFFRSAAPAGGNGGGGALRPALGVIRVPALRELIRAMWDPAAAGRPSAEEVVRRLQEMTPPATSRLKAACREKSSFAGCALQ